MVKTPADLSTSVTNDIKETYKRVFQLGFVNLFLSLGVLLLNLFLGNYVTVALTGVLAVCLSILLVLNYYKAPFIKTGSVIIINLFLTLICLAEGSRSGAYLYFFPVIAGLPLIFETSNKNRRELRIYILLTIISFSISVYFCRQLQPWQVISMHTYQVMFFTNITCSFLLCIVFSYLNVYFERRFANALLEERNRTHDAMQARTRFLSNMGHELRTPLNGIIGTANLLRKGKILPEQEQDFEILKYCSDHMLELVNDILDFNKIEAGKLELHLETFNLNKLLQKALLPFYNRFEEKNIALKHDIDRKLNAYVIADDVRLVQIINNLLSNALKFTEHGSVTLKAECIEKSAKEVRVKICVIDTGIGIHDEDQYKIFDSFWQAYNQSTRKYSGTGLGLTICHRLLHLMSSELKFESKPGLGTTFNFTMQLPVADKQATEKKKTELANLEGYNILIAEDNQINMAVIKKTLLDWKAKTTICWNGLEAVNAIKTGNHFDLVMLDLEMPVMDGYTAVQEIRLLDPDIPIIAFTAALIDTEMYQKLISLGFTDCVLKPFRPQELFSKIVHHITAKAVN